MGICIEWYADEVMHSKTRPTYLQSFINETPGLHLTSFSLGAGSHSVGRFPGYPHFLLTCIVTSSWLLMLYYWYQHFWQQKTHSNDWLLQDLMFLSAPSFLLFSLFPFSLFSLFLLYFNWILKVGCNIILFYTCI